MNATTKTTTTTVNPVRCPLGTPWCSAHLAETGQCVSGAIDVGPQIAVWALQEPGTRMPVVAVDAGSRAHLTLTESAALKDGLDELQAAVLEGREVRFHGDTGTRTVGAAADTDAPRHKLGHIWRVDEVPARGDDPEALVLWCDGRYVAHLSRGDAWALGCKLATHEESPVDLARRFFQE